MKNHYKLIKVTLTSIVLVCMTAGYAIAGGTGAKQLCASRPAITKTNLTEPVFVPPFDSQMGQIVVAVPKVSVSAPCPGSAGDLGQLVRSQLAACLSQSQNFIVADRETLNEIGQEHKLAESGAVNPLDKPMRGQLAGPRYLIKVDVTDFKEDALGKAKSVRFEAGGFLKCIGSIAGGEAGKVLTAIGSSNPTIGNGRETIRGTVGIELRIIDVDTGSIVRATRATGSITRDNSRSVFGVAGLSTTNSEFNQSVVAESMRSAIQDAVQQIHSILKDQVLASNQTHLAGNTR
jgi:curli biogenesis system outer membrane secretion channel CsgG